MKMMLTSRFLLAASDRQEGAEAEESKEKRNGNCHEAASADVNNVENDTHNELNDEPGPNLLMY